MFTNLFAFDNNFKLTFEEYSSGFENNLLEFLKASENNTERYFIADQKKRCNQQIIDIQESLDGLYGYKAGREDYFYYLVNRFLFFDSEDIVNLRTIVFDSDECSDKFTNDSNEGCVESKNRIIELINFERNVEKLCIVLRDRLAVNYKILDFLEHRKKQIKPGQGIEKPDKINLRSISIDVEKYNIAIQKLLDNQIITRTKDSYSVQKPKEDTNLSYERWCCAIGLMLQDRHYIKPSTKQTEIVKALNNTFNLKLVKQNYSSLLKDRDKNKTQDYLIPLYFL